MYWLIERGPQKIPGEIARPDSGTSWGGCTLALLAVLPLAGCETASPAGGIHSGTDTVVVALSDPIAFSVPVDPSRIVTMPLGDRCVPSQEPAALPRSVEPVPVAAPWRPPDKALPSDGPLLALGAYISHSGNCDPDLVTWNGLRLKEATTGQLPRYDYYRMLTYLPWGGCRNPAFVSIQEKLLEAAHHYGDGAISTPEFETEEAELIDRFFVAVREDQEAPAFPSTDTFPRKAALENRPSPSFPATRLSTAPLQALAAYIELSGTCSRNLVEWNREYGARAMMGETSRAFYFRVLSYLDWGNCGRDFFPPVFHELLKSAEIFAQGSVSAAEFEAKEAELVTLLFAALSKEARGMESIRDYERKTSERLIDLREPKQYFNCTFFGGTPRCWE